MEVVDGRNPEQANDEAKKGLNLGASSILYWVHDNDDLSALLDGIRGDIAPVHLVGELQAISAAEVLAGIDGIGDWTGSFNLDPAEQLTREGQWMFGNKEAHLNELQHAADLLPHGIRVVCANAMVHQSPAEQIAMIVASLTFQLNHIGWKHAGRTWVLLHATGDYLQDIAMTQALRGLWKQVLESNDHGDQPLWIAGHVSSANSEDAADLINSGLSMQAMRLGGADEIWLDPLNDSKEAKQWAREQFLVMAYESGLDQTSLQGSYTLDDWTCQLMAQAQSKVESWTSKLQTS